MWAIRRVMVFGFLVALLGVLAFADGSTRVYLNDTTDYSIGVGGSETLSIPVTLDSDSFINHTFEATMTSGNADMIVTYRSTENDIVVRYAIRDQKTFGDPVVDDRLESAQCGSPNSFNQLCKGGGCNNQDFNQKHNYSLILSNGTAELIVDYDAVSVNPAFCTSVPNLSSIEFSWGGAGTDLDVFSNLVLGANIAPVADSSLPNLSWPEDTSFVFNISGNFSDSNGDALGFTSSDVENISINVDNSTGLVNLTPDPDFFGTRTVVFFADDGDNLTGSNNVTLNVTGVNDLPSLSSVTLTSTDDQNRTNGTLTVGWTFSDPDGDSATQNQTAWFVNGTEQSGLANLTSVSSSNTSKTQNWTVSVRVSDGTNFTQLINASLLIEDSLPRFLHAFSNQQAERNEVFTYGINATDLDEDAFTLSDNSSQFAIQNDGVINFTPQNEGDFTFNITLNQSGYEESDVFTLEVTDTAAPEITSISTSNSGSDPVSVSLQVDTDETAICRFSEQNLNFTNMTGMSSTNASSHLNSESFSSDTSGIYFVRCQDSYGNTMNESRNATYSVTISDDSSGDSSGSGGGGGSGGGYTCRLVWDCTSWSACEEGEQDRTCKLRQVAPFTSLDSCPQHTIPEQERSCEVEPKQTCTDGIRNQDETGVDCGGSCAACGSDTLEEPAMPAEETDTGDEGSNQITGNVVGMDPTATYWGFGIALVILLAGLQVYFRLYPKDIPQEEVDRILQEAGVSPDSGLEGPAPPEEDLRKEY